MGPGSRRPDKAQAGTGPGRGDIQQKIIIIIAIKKIIDSMTISMAPTGPLVGGLKSCVFVASHPVISESVG